MSTKIQKGKHHDILQRIEISTRTFDWQIKNIVRNDSSKHTVKSSRGTRFSRLQCIAGQKRFRLIGSIENRLENLSPGGETKLQYGNYITVIVGYGV